MKKFNFLLSFCIMFFAATLVQAQTCSKKKAKTTEVGSAVKSVDGATAVKECSKMTKAECAKVCKKAKTKVASAVQSVDGATSVKECSKMTKAECAKACSKMTKAECAKKCAKAKTKVASALNERSAEENSTKVLKAEMKTLNKEVKKKCAAKTLEKS